MNFILKFASLFAVLLLLLFLDEDDEPNKLLNLKFPLLLLLEVFPEVTTGTDCDDVKPEDNGGGLWRLKDADEEPVGVGVLPGTGDDMEDRLLLLLLLKNENFLLLAGCVC